MKIADIAIDHDYYSSGSNYYSNEARVAFSHWPAFIDEFGDADEDMNLCYRWDVYRDDHDRFYMEISMMRQRKGIYTPIHIGSVTDEDVPSIIEYLGRHWAKLQRLWCPISIADLSSIADPVEVRAKLLSKTKPNE